MYDPRRGSHIRKPLPPEDAPQAAQGLPLRTGASLDDADPVRIVLIESKQGLLGPDHAVRVTFSVVAEQAHGDAVRHGANRPVVAGEIVGVANFAGFACAPHQLLDLAALAGVELRLAGVEVRIERHDPLISLRPYATKGAPHRPPEPPRGPG